MRRLLTYNITGQNRPSTIKEFLKEKHFSSQNLIELKKRERSVLLNGCPARMIDPLRDGDVLNIEIVDDISSEKIPPVELPLSIVYEDEDIIIINKEAGMPIHPSMNHYENTVANGLAMYYEKQNMPFVFRCINRLDRDTSGLTLIAKHSVSAGILSGMIHAPGKDSIRREYLAIVRDKVNPPSGTIDVPLGRKSGSIIERTVDFENGERAITHYQTVEYANGHSLIALQLETGRTHQIRIHMKYLGYPLIGDYLYNPDMEFITRQALHSHKLSFSHPITGEYMEFTAPLPQDMETVIHQALSL